jgi:VWFA-related protein
VALALVFTGWSGSAAQDTPPVFRATADAVRVSVAVQRSNRPVTDLTIADFALLDNGVPQAITAVNYEALPIDATVLLDISASVSGAAVEQLQRSIPDLRRSLRSGDRLSVVAFNMRIRRLLDITPAAGSEATAPRLAASGSSAVLDALAVALSSRGDPDRRQLVVLFSDGRDSISVTDAGIVLDVARRTTPTVSVVLSSPARIASDRVYADLAAQTGGTVVSLLPSDTLGDSLRSAIERFRSSYVLTYSPSGVARDGAHALEVQVNRPGVDVRARRGYVVR